MTRKEALLRTIELVKESTIQTNLKQDIIHKLKLCISELPYARWSEEAIFDACDQFIIDNQREITMGDFNRTGLPSHPTIKNRFGLTAKEFRDKYYPLNSDRNHSRYGKKSAEYLIAIFQNEFKLIKPNSANEYNSKRSAGTPCWYTVARLVDERSWLGLLRKLDIVPYHTSQQKVRKTYCLSRTIDSEKKMQEIEENINNM